MDKKSFFSDKISPGTQQDNFGIKNEEKNSGKVALYSFVTYKAKKIYY
jgi:hypothetical protein